MMKSYQPQKSKPSTKKPTYLSVLLNSKNYWSPLDSPLESTKETFSPQSSLTTSSTPSGSPLKSVSPSPLKQDFSATSSCTPKLHQQEKNSNHPQDHHPQDHHLQENLEENDVMTDVTPPTRLDTTTTTKLTTSKELDTMEVFPDYTNVFPHNPEGQINEESYLESVFNYFNLYSN